MTKNQWPHLKDLPLMEVGGKVDILLGVDHADLMLPSEHRIGGTREPCAMKTTWGWIVRRISSQLKPKIARMNMMHRAPEEPNNAAFQQDSGEEIEQAEASGTTRAEDDAETKILGVCWKPEIPELSSECLNVRHLSSCNGRGMLIGRQGYTLHLWFRRHDGCSRHVFQTRLHGY